MSKKLLNLCLMAAMFVISTSAWALDKKDGAYQIGTADDFKAFAELVNGGENAAWGVLTADIDLGTELTMIGTSASNFIGTFDGQGHSITINYFPEEDNCAVVRYLGRRGMVRNLVVKGDITTGKKYAAGIAAQCYGAVQNCVVDVKVKSSVVGDATHGGIAGVAYQNCWIRNCFVKFDIDGATTTNCGGIVGWCNDDCINVQNCVAINTNNMNNMDTSGTIGRNGGNLKTFSLSQYLDPVFQAGVGAQSSGATYGNLAMNKWVNENGVSAFITEEDLKSGKACYLLNHDQSDIQWTQSIGTDDYPLPNPNGKQVYANMPLPCTGKAVSEEDEAAPLPGVEYSNTATPDVAAVKHTMDEHGVCTTCGYYNADVVLDNRDDADGFIKISSVADLDNFEVMNQVQNGSWLGMKFMNDIEYTAAPGQGIFNTANWMSGDINGQGHTLTVHFTDVPDDAGVFVKYRAKIRDLKVSGDITAVGRYLGVIGRTTGETTLTNIYCDLDIYTKYVGDNTTGGIIGLCEKGNSTMNNVIFAGKIRSDEGLGATNVGGICGWASSRVYMNNVAQVGEIINIGGDSYPISRNGTITVPNNVYYVYQVQGDVTGTELAANVQIPSEAVANGELAYLLNQKVEGGENFYQVIDTDPIPMPFAKEGGKVYSQASEYSCNGQPEEGASVTYANTPSSTPIPEHQFLEDCGICDHCGNLNYEFLTPAADGFYEIATGGEMLWWAKLAAEKLNVSARLTADIDMSEYSDRYPVIGLENAPFYGNFDGQHHTISSLVINHPDVTGVGLIGCMNSLGSKGPNDAAARDAEGSYIKNVTLDSNCEIIGRGYCGIVGMTAPWPGHVVFYNIGMEGNVTCTGAANGGGVLGCVMSSTCAITLDNCFMSGNVVGPNENGSFSGWLGSYATVTNCYAIGVVDETSVTDKTTIDGHYFARFSTATFNNCYSLRGNQANINITSEAAIANGELAFKMNGGSCSDVLWYQNLSEDSEEWDVHPTPNPAHGVVFKMPADINDETAVPYMSVANEEELTLLVEEIQRREGDFLAENVADIALKNAYQKSLDALADLTTVAEVAEAWEGMADEKSAVSTSATVYQAYMDMCANIQAQIEVIENVEGEDLENLKSYLEGVDEPTADWPLGAYNYIISEQLYVDSVITKETARVEEMYKTAVRNGYSEGANITALLVNANFAQGNTGWTSPSSAYQGAGPVNATVDGVTYHGMERWAGPLDITQSISGLKPGYYLVSMNAAVRPGNDRYSYNYNAQLSANGNATFLMTSREGMISVDEAVDQVNANIAGSTADLKIYEDEMTTDDAAAEAAGVTLLGYAPHGQLSMALAIAGNRLLNYVVAEVGEDGVLTINLKNETSKYGNDWTGFGNAQVIYCGDKDSELTKDAYTKMINGQLARAYSNRDKYIPNGTTPGLAPNYPNEVKEALAAGITAAEAATTVDAMQAAATDLSTTFKNLYAGKIAYYEMNNTALVLNEVSNMVYGYEEEFVQMMIQDAAGQAFDAYEKGTYTLEEALDPSVFNIEEIAPYIPEMKDGVMQIANPRQLAYFSAYVSHLNASVSADVVNDLMMSENDGERFINFSPIGSGKSTTYTGTFDGKGHAIDSLHVSGIGTYSGLFYRMDGTVKNLKITGNYSSDYKHIGGICGDLGGTVENCDVRVVINSTVVGDGTHGGIAGRFIVDGATVKNCFVKNIMIGAETDCWGGVVGWATNKGNIINTVMVSEVYGKTSGSHTFSRNPDNATITNSYYMTPIEVAAGTKIDVAQMKSGQMAYLLNGSQSDEPVWFQTIGVDTIPHLFTGDVVYYYGNEYQNRKPVYELNSYAYNIKTGSNAEAVTVEYELNGPAKAGEIRFYNGTEIVYTEALTSDFLTEGAHSVSVANSKLPAAGTKLTLDVKIEGVGAEIAHQIGGSYKTWSTQGMAINNAPESAGFGTLYALESYGQGAPKNSIWGVGTDHTGYISDNKLTGLYAFTPTFEQINAEDGTPGFKGGLDYTGKTYINGTNVYDLKDITVSKDGRVFIGRGVGNTNSPVVEVNPANLDADWTPVFTGGEVDEATGVTYVGDEAQAYMVASLATEGAGKDLKLWVLGGARSNGEANVTDFVCNAYELGTAKSWDKVPSTTFDGLTGKYTITGHPVTILPDTRGGLWYIQHRSSPTEELPAVKHFNAEGKEDFSDVSTNYTGGSATISADGTYIAISQSGKIVVYSCDYVPMANGKLYLNPVINVPTVEDTPTAVAFDYAGNLYVASSSTETVSRYTFPSIYDNVVVTPANAAAAFTVGEDKETAIEGVEAETQNGEIYTLGGVRVQKAQKGINIVNGKKVLVK